MKISVPLLLMSVAVVVAQELTTYRSTPVVVKDGVAVVKTASRTGGITRNWKLEGAGTLWRVSCLARGEGKAQLGVLGSHGWGYSPECELSATEWRAFEVLYYERLSAFTSRMYTLEDKPVTLEMKELALEEVAMPVLKDSAVPSCVFEAEDFPGRNAKLYRDKEASGGGCVSGGLWYELAVVPVPVTSRPLYVHCRVKKTAPQALNLTLVCRRNMVASAAIPAGDGWQWIAFGPLPMQQLWPSMKVSLSGETHIDVMLDKIVVGTDSALSDASVPYPEHGYATAVKAVVPPKMDGTLDDVCWQHAIVLSPFTVNSEGVMASETTMAKVMWDETYLYLSFRCEETCLVPAANRQHEFRNEKTGNDSEKIWAQDCVLAILQPDSTKAVCYDFAVSAAGDVLDSRMTGNDIWGTRDTSWDGGVRAATCVGDGYWNAELAIPLKAMEASPASDWRFLLGRIEQSRKEFSSWNMVRGGFHLPENFGVLRLVENAPGCLEFTLPDIASGRNKVTFTASEPVLFLAQTQYGKEKPESFTGISATEGVFNVAGNGRFRLECSLLRADTLEPLLRYPALQCSMSSVELTWKLSAGTVKLNGRESKSGVLMKDGINRLELVADGEVEGTFQAGELSFDTKSGWCRKDGLLTRYIAIGQSRIWPEWRAEGLVLSEGGLQDLTVMPLGFEGFKLNDYTFHFDLPEGFSLAGAIGKYKVWSIVLEDGGPVTHEGKPFRRSSIRFTKTVPYAAEILSWRCLSTLIRSPEKCQEGEYALFYSAGSREHAITEIPIRVPLKMTPHLDGVKAPLSLSLQMWMGNWFGAMDDNECRRLYVEHLAQMGVNETFLTFKDPRINIIAMIGLENWQLDQTEFIKAHPDTPSIKFDGSPRKMLPCTSVMLTDPEWNAFLRNTLIPAYMKKYAEPDHVDWDYEFGVFDGDIACYCPRCLALFCKCFPDVPPDVTPERIKTDFAQQWVKFQNRRMADMAGLFRDALHAYKPGVIFSVYSGYHNDFTKQKYGVDWAMLKDKIDRAMCGYGRPVDNLEATRAAIGDIPFTLGIISQPYEITKRAHPSCFTPAELMRRLCDSSAGILLYAYNTLDARSFHAIARISHVMKKYERFFTRHDTGAAGTIDVHGLEPQFFSVLRDADGKLLVSVMNLSVKPLKYNLTLPGSKEMTGILKPADFVIREP